MTAGPTTSTGTSTVSSTAVSTAENTAHPDQPGTNQRGTDQPRTNGRTTDLHGTSARTILITNPRDGSMVGRLPIPTSEEISRVVAAAHDAFTSWSAVPAAERGALLRDAADSLAAHENDVAGANANETGRPFDQALEGVRAGVGTLRQYAELGPVHRGHSLRGGRTAADYSVREARGVVVALTPWNDPVAVAAGLLGAAIVSGNTVIHKPSERSPHTGRLVGEILSEALPAGVLQTVTGDGDTGRELAALPGIAVIAHVGSTATGNSISRAAALTGAHVVKENGGNDALIVDRDVDPVWAAQQAAIGAFANTGQICTSVERIFVHRELATSFIEAVIAEARDRNDMQVLGPLVDVAMRDLVHGQVAESIAAGAVAMIGGVIPGGAGAFYPATVLTECLPWMPVMAQETFGPVAAVQVVDSFSQALALAAADRYGLAATVLTGSMENAQRAVHELPVGTVKVNAVFGGAPGGSSQPRGDSGSGFGYGPELLDEMTTMKVVHLGVPGHA